MDSNSTYKWQRGHVAVDLVQVLDATGKGFEGGSIRIVNQAPRSGPRTIQKANWKAIMDAPRIAAAGDMNAHSTTWNGRCTSNQRNGAAAAF